MTEGPGHNVRKGKNLRWYDLFSRGVRDWLRHNEKVREAVREQLPDIISGSGVLGGGDRTVRVPVKFLEHYRFRLRPPESQDGAGQGEAKSGDVLKSPMSPGSGQDKGAGGSEDGGVEFVLELKVDDIVDWLWEELELPNLQPKEGGLTDDEYAREGWDRRGARSRLDRRRSLKEAIKRRAVQSEGPAFSDDDLRYRQLVKRPRPATQAVVFFAMDVSASMTERDRQTAKTFFFWVVQGLRRRYTRLEAAFVAHTTEAWEFNEDEFFQVAGSGGTVASKAFVKVNEILEDRYDPARYNVYLFYASDGENFSEDHEPARKSLQKLGEVASFLGYAEIAPTSDGTRQTETTNIFKEVSETGAKIGSYRLGAPDSVWEAIRAFFQEQIEEEEDA